MKKISVLIITIISLSITFIPVDNNAYAEAVTGAVVTQGAQGAVQSKVTQEAAGKSLSSQIGEYFNTPAGILVVSGIATVYSTTLYNAAAQQEEDAIQNIKKLDRIIAEFKDSYVGFCPDGRDDLKTPDCYCYLAKGGPNPDRSKSQICQSLWARNNFKNSATAGDYSGISRFVDPVGCLTINGQFDEKCKCKKFLDSKGNNACQKGVSINLPAGIGSAMFSTTGLREVTQFAANTGNGNPMFNNFNVGSMQARAIATEKMKAKLLSQVLPLMGSNKPNIPTITSKNVNQVVKAAFGEKNIAAAIPNYSKSSMDLIAASHASGKMAEIVKTAEKKIGFDFSGGGKGLLNKKADMNGGFTLNLGGEATASNGATQLQDFPEKEKNYKIKGDISKQTDTSIFDIISNRYMQSGLKRLFED